MRELNSVGADRSIMTRRLEPEYSPNEQFLDPAAIADIRANCALPRGAADVAVETNNRHGVVIIAVSGAVDVLTVPAFSVALESLLTQPQRCVVLDLTGIDFFGSAAIRELINFSQGASKQGFNWAVVGSHAVLRPLQLLGTFGGLPVCGSVHRAVALISAE